MEDTAGLWNALGGLGIGLLFGIVAQRSRLCLVAAVSGGLLVRDYRHIQAFLAAWLIAIAGTATLETLGLVAVAESAYRATAWNWSGALAGGLLFGFGAALAGGCAARTLVRTAEGHLGGLLALLAMALFATLTQYGLLAPLRVWLLQHTAIELALHGTGHDTGLAAVLGIPGWLGAGAVSALTLLALYRLGPLRANLGLLAAGAGIGLLAVAGWLLTGWLSQDEFAPTRPRSLTITGPLARLSLSVGSGQHVVWQFGTTFISGVFVGALLSALYNSWFKAGSGGFRWQQPESGRLPHYLLGGAMMGIGAIVAGGCNIGQGLSGVSTLSLTSLLAAGAIFTGTVLGVKWWERHA